MGTADLGRSAQWVARASFAAMDYEVVKWVRVVHIYAMLTWAGSLIGLSFILKQHAKADAGAKKDFTELEKGVAMAMDIGATFAIIAGLVMLFGIEPSPFKGGGWLHAKLLLVAILVGCHGVQRMRVGKLKRGEDAPEPGWIIPVIEICVIGIIVLASGRPF